jgi:hypothetical protein
LEIAFHLLLNSKKKQLGCNLTIAYEMNEHRKSGPYTYILDGALTAVQGHAPPNAIIDVVPVSSKA